MIQHARGAKPAAHFQGMFATPFVQSGLALVLFFGVALAVDATLADGARFTGITPHPFWAIVLLLSARFGLLAGLAVAALSSVVLLTGNLPAQAFSQDRYQYVYAVGQLPLAWFLAAGLVGGLRSRLLQLTARAAARKAGDSRRYGALAQAYRDLKTEAGRLEEHIAGEERTVGTVCEAARDLSLAAAGTDPERALRAAAVVLRELLRPQKFSLFLALPGGCRAAFTEGWAEDDPWSRELDTESELVRQVVDEERLLSVGQPQDRFTLHGQGVLAGPLVDPHTGRAYGMVKVEQMAFLNLNTCNVENFRIACEWLGPALAGLLGPPHPSGARRQKALAHPLLHALARGEERHA